MKNVINAILPSQFCVLNRTRNSPGVRIFSSRHVNLQYENAQMLFVFLLFVSFVEKQTRLHVGSNRLPRRRKFVV